MPQYATLTAIDSLANGTRKTGLSPAIVYAKTLGLLADVSSKVTLTEIGNGDYRLAYDPDAYGDAAIQVDLDSGGAGANLTLAGDRYPTVVIRRGVATKAKRALVDAILAKRVPNQIITVSATDNATVQAAITTAKAAATSTNRVQVYFPAGTYTVTAPIDISVVDFIDLAGDGPGLSILTTTSEVDVIMIGGSGATIRDLSARQAAATSNHYGIHADSSGSLTAPIALVHNCEVTSTSKSGIGIGIQANQTIILSASRFDSTYGTDATFNTFAGIFAHDNADTGSALLLVLDCVATSKYGPGLNWASMGKSSGVAKCIVHGGYFRGAAGAGDIVAWCSYTPGLTGHCPITGTYSPALPGTGAWVFGGVYNGRTWWYGVVTGTYWQLYFDGTNWICGQTDYAHYTTTPYLTNAANYWAASPPAGSWSAGVTFAPYGANTGNPNFVLLDEAKLYYDAEVSLATGIVGRLATAAPVQAATDISADVEQWKATAAPAMTGDAFAQINTKIPQAFPNVAPGAANGLPLLDANSKAPETPHTSSYLTATPGTSNYAGGDTSGTTTLLTRIPQALPNIAPGSAGGLPLAGTGGKVAATVASGDAADLAPVSIATTTGNWGTAGTWASGHVPNVGDNIIIRNGVTVTIAADQDLRLYGSLQVQGTGALNVGAASVTVPSGWVIATNVNGSITANYGTVTTNSYGATVVANYGTVTTNSGTVTINYATATINSGIVTTNQTRGTVGSGTAGTVANNYGIVVNNSGCTVSNNHAGGVVANNSGGTVTTNTGYVGYPLLQDADGAAKAVNKAAGAALAVAGEAAAALTATDAIPAAAIKADAVTKIQAGLSKPGTAQTITAPAGMALEATLQDPTNGLAAIKTAIGSGGGGGSTNASDFTGAFHKSVLINSPTAVVNVTPAYIGKSSGGTPTAILPEAWLNSFYSVTFPLLDGGSNPIDVSAVPLTMDFWSPNDLAHPPTILLAAATADTTDATLTVTGTNHNNITLTITETALETLSAGTLNWLLRPTANDAAPYSSGKLSIINAPPIVAPTP